MKVELHLLQNFPPVNLNRDDTGQPKDCEFGGVRRGRVSSQSLKRSIRRHDAFSRILGDRIALRTKKSADVVTKHLVERGHDAEDARLMAEAVVGKMLGWDAAKKNTKVLFYVGLPELGQLAEIIDAQATALRAALEPVKALPEGAKDKERKAAESGLDQAAGKVADAFKQADKDAVRAVDVALFGRMLAEMPGLNVDASCQVAHAISTNRVDLEFDYFTAVDDLNEREETGAGMIGNTGFNAPCYYRYALLDVDQLAENLGGDRDLALEGVRAFLEASYQAIPSGKQNTFAGHTPPSLFMTVVRTREAMPWSLANAFATPITPRDGEGLIERSVAELDAHWSDLADMYGDDGTQVFVKVARGVNRLSALKDYEQNSVPDVIDATMQALSPLTTEASA